MIYLFGFIGLIYLTYQAGKQDKLWFIIATFINLLLGEKVDFCEAKDG